MEITDKVVDYGAICKKHGIPPVASTIEKHVVSFKIANWFCGMTNMLRYVLTVLYPTKRIAHAEISSSDNELRLDNIYTRIKFTIISSKCQETEFKYERKPGPISYFGLSQVRNLERYVNAGQLCPVGDNKAFTISGTIEEARAADTDSAHEFCQSFDRIEMTQKVVGEFRYDTGTIVIKYQDNIDGKTVLAKAFAIMKEIVANLQNNIDEYFGVGIDAPYLIIPDDRSSIIAHCLRYWFYKEKPGLIYVIKPPNEKKQCIISFSLISPPEVKEIILRGLANFTSELNRERL